MYKVYGSSNIFEMNVQYSFRNVSFFSRIAWTEFYRNLYFKHSFQDFQEFEYKHSLYLIKYSRKIT